jgi:acetaldehyde dehydrogenase/alcohol dehydrogenase
VDDDDQALALSRLLLQHEGAGHTAVIHTADEARVQRFARQVPASRILVNVPASLGCCGVLTGLDPSFTLGCGTLGGNSTTDNVSYRHLVNVQRVARMQYDNMLRMRRLGNRVAEGTRA